MGLERSGSRASSPDLADRFPSLGLCPRQTLLIDPRPVFGREDLEHRASSWPQLPAASRWPGHPWASRRQRTARH